MKIYPPFWSVVVVANTSPLLSYNVTITLGIPVSPGSCTPSPLVSNHTKSPIEPNSGTTGVKPKSTVVMSSPGAKVTVMLDGVLGVVPSGP